MLEHSGGALPNRRLPRVRRIAVGVAVVMGLAGSYSYALVTLIEVPDGNRFRGWPLFVFCAAAFVVAALGVVADNRRLARQNAETETPQEEPSSDASAPEPGARDA